MSKELNDEFKKNPLEFFRQHPVVPPSDLGQKLQNLTVLFDEKTIGKDVSGTATKEVKSAVTDPTDLIRYVDFKVSTSMNEPGALTFSGTKDPKPDTVPIYFLPWRSMHLVKMTIPELSARDYDIMDRTPHIFFTAAINGCSVFVKGPPTAPEVSHAGIDGTLARDAAQFWRDCLAKAEGPRRGQVREVNKAHYTKDNAYVGPARTPLAGDYMRWLQDQHRQRFTISEVAPWGCVFGIRFGRLWSFYLQENATVTTLEFIKKKHVVKRGDWYQTKVGSFNVVTEQQQTSFMGIKYNTTVYAAKRTATRPMRISDFYPGGAGRYTSAPLFTKIG